MIWKILKNYWPGITITVVVFAFLSNLFFPRLSLLVTPDYGRSDSWSLSIADSYYYAQELKNNHFPIWNPHIGNGFPTFAEGQTGELYPLNFVLFRILPFPLAYNLTITFTLIIAATGAYLFCRSLKISRYSATFAGLIFSLGGFFVFHLQHHALIETASLLPWLFWATNEFINSKKIKFLLFISIFSSLQILSGFPQLAFYAEVSIALYVSLHSIFNKSAKLKPLILVVCAIILGLFLASIQLLPSYEFLKLSTRSANPGEILSQFPYLPKNLLQFLNPFILGSPKDGTYPLWQPGKWGIFWESSAYIGVLPLILGLGTIFGTVFKSKKNIIVFCMSGIFALTLLLALGKESPLYVIFTIPPFSLFRVPSRFLLPASFALVTLSAIYLDKLKKSVALLFMTLSILDIFIFLKNYNPTLEASALLKKPKTAQYLSENLASNVYTVGTVSKWNESFVKNGWGSIKKFFFFKNYLDQNSNLIFNIDQFSAYESIQTRRQAFLKSQIANNIKFVNQKYYFSDKAIKLLAATNTNHIISPYEINSSLVDKVFTYQEENGKVNIYKIKDSLDPIFLSKEATSVETIPDITSAISNANFDPQKAPLVENQISLTGNEPRTSRLQLIKQSSTEVTTKTQTSGPQILTYNQTIYPGWEAYLDSQKVAIIPSNINSMAIEIPEGDHVITFRYFPRTLVVGLLISFASVLITLMTFLKYRNLKVS